MRRVQTLTAPGDEYHTRYITQPIIDRESVNVRVNKAPTRVVNHPAQREQVVTRNRVITKTVNVPG